MLTVPESNRVVTWWLFVIEFTEVNLDANAASTSSSNNIDFSGTCESFFASAKSVKSASAKFNKQISKFRWPASALIKDVFPQPRKNSLNHW